MLTHKLLSSSLSGLLYSILDINHKKELLRGFWVSAQDANAAPRNPRTLEHRVEARKLRMVLGTGPVSLLEDSR